MIKPKYKAWDKSNKIMRDVSSINFDKEIVYCKLIELEELGIGLEFDFAEIELLQFTGLKDKYDVDIYEGDICKVTHSNDTYEYTETTTIYEVGYSRYAFRFLRNKRKHSLELSKAIRIEVIGNIFQNKDLVEVK